MATAQELAVRDKKELVSKEEKTVPGRYYVPYADIYETDDALSVVMEMPGVEKKDLNVALENDVLRVDGRIDFSKYEGMEPVYTEYNVGHYTRSFTLSNKIDQERISAQLDDGVLTLTLPKAKEAQPRRISIGQRLGRGRWPGVPARSSCRGRSDGRQAQPEGRPVTTGRRCGSPARWIACRDAPGAFCRGARRTSGGLSALARCSGRRAGVQPVALRRAVRPAAALGTRLPGAAVRDAGSRPDPLLPARVEGAAQPEQGPCGAISSAPSPRSGGAT